MTKVYDYAVIWNGEIIPANTPIEVKEEEKAVETKTAEKPKKKAVKSDDKA